MREKLETLSVSVLRDFAKDKKIKNISAMRKSELIDGPYKCFFAFIALMPNLPLIVGSVKTSVP